MRLLRILPLAALLACSLGQEPAFHGNVPGTYEILVCRGGCGRGDVEHAYVRGTVILTASQLGDAGTYALGWGPPNGCFELQQVQDLGDSYAGIIVAGFIHWTQQGDTIRFPIYQSPDAGYDIELSRSDSGLIGWGNSWGAGVVEIHAPRDSIWTRRMGPPDPTQCREGP